MNRLQPRIPTALALGVCQTRPCEALLDGIYGVTLPATFPKPDVVTAERYDVVELFLQFPLGLPIELKGITA